MDQEKLKYYGSRLANEFIEALLIVVIYSVVKQQKINWFAAFVLGILTFVLEESPWKAVGKEIKNGVVFSVGSAMI